MIRTDAQLLLDARTDAAAFRELYERYAVRICDYFRRRTGDEDAAYDLTAETFAQVWLVRARFRDEAGGSAGPWLFAIARNVLLMAVRRQRLEHRARERLGLIADADHEETWVTPEFGWLDGLDEALEELPRPQREALRLRVEADLAYEDVGAALGTSPQAARARVHRALVSLRRRLIDPMETTP